MGENYVELFHQLSRDHCEADLLWNQETRAELRTALETALRELQHQRENSMNTNEGGHVSWNHREFRVSYPSLHREHILRCRRVDLI